MADIFCRFFTEIGKKQAERIGQSTRPPEEYIQQSIKSSIFLSPVTENEVFKVTQALNTKHSVGWDKLSTHHLKQLAPALLLPLSILIN